MAASDHTLMPMDATQSLTVDKRAAAKHRLVAAIVVVCIALAAMLAASPAWAHGAAAPAAEKSGAFQPGGDIDRHPGALPERHHDHGECGIAACFAAFLAEGEFAIEVPARPAMRCVARDFSRNIVFPPPVRPPRSAA